MATAASRPIAAPAIHGILSAYPLACFTGALATDIAYANSANMQWANFSVWLIAAGATFGVLAALVGVVEAVRRHGVRRRRAPLWHGVATTLMLALAIVNGFVHSRDAWTSVVPDGLVLSAIVAALALVTAWNGYALQAENAR